MQGTGETLDLGVGSFHQMETAEQHVNVRIHRRSRAQDFFNSGMRTSYNYNQPTRIVNRQTKFAQLKSSRHLGDCRDNENTWRDLQPGLNEHEVRPWPGTPCGDRFGFLSLEITHILGQSIHGFVKPFGKRASKDAE